MQNDTGEKTMNFHFVRKGTFTREKEEHLQAKPYLDLLAHFNAELIQTGASVTIVKHDTGDELPLEQRGKLQMVQLLLREFGTVDGVNAAIGKYRALHT